MVSDLIDWSLPWPAPKSLSRPQNAVMTAAGTPKSFILAREHRLVLLDLGGAARKPSAGQHLVGHFEEGLREEALAAVDVDDALVEDQVGRGGVDGRLRDALGQRPRS